MCQHSPEQPHDNAEVTAETTPTGSHSRRDFLRDSLLSGSVAALGSLGLAYQTTAQSQGLDAAGSAPKLHYIPASNKTVHWGYFSKSLPPVVEVDSGDYVTIETLTHHAADDLARMVTGDPGAESVYRWDKDGKGVDRRGAGPMDASLFGRGAGEGLGVHICTGPVAVKGAEPGDVLEVRIVDVKPRPSANPQFKGKAFGSNAAAWWGFHFNDLLTEPKQREVIT
ncbi:MAG: acetamidase/formamidase family protein, partial [Candidatus Competibacteraceae bacterium]|nr:acetamidase/formamidase family protein [Candidatus Competibacteraceae bacterium]